jgi:hypothetical protein
MARTGEPTGTYDDVNLILRLYDLRREPRLREARAWFVSKFYVNSVEEMMQLCPPGSEENASMRMVVSYWDMAASFITAGILKKELFFESNREMLLTWERMKPIVAALRERFQDPLAWHNLETVAKDFVEWMEKRAPGSHKAWLERLAAMRR